MTTSHTIRRRYGEFETPSTYADIAHQYIIEAMRRDRADEDPYSRTWWEPSCGNGSLLMPFPSSDTGKIFASSLSRNDFDTKLDTDTGNVRKFQYDFLNDPDSDLPADLIKALDACKRWGILVNPPFTATTSVRDDHMAEVRTSAVAAQMVKQGFKRAAHVSALQFLFRILQFADAFGLDLIVGAFTPAALLTHDSYKSFRELWLDRFVFCGGFCANGREFGADGDWPIIFSVWRLRNQGEATTACFKVDVFECGSKVGEKMFAECLRPLSRWIDRPDNVEPAVPLTSALTVDQGSNVLLRHLPHDALGFCAFTGNDVMHSKQCFLLSSAYARGAGWGVTEENFEETLIALGIRWIVASNWLNDRDQFGIPNLASPEYRQWSRDLVVWTLASNANHSASFTAVYNEERHDVRNHFFWMRPDEISSEQHMPIALRAQAAMSQCPFVANWLTTQELSHDARRLLGYMKAMVIETAAERPNADPLYQLDRWDAGWYQLRRGVIWHPGAKRRAKGRIAVFRQFKHEHALFGRRLAEYLPSLGILTGGEHLTMLKHDDNELAQ